MTTSNKETIAIVSVYDEKRDTTKDTEVMVKDTANAVETFDRALRNMPPHYSYLGFKTTSHSVSSDNLRDVVNERVDEGDIERPNSHDTNVTEPPDGANEDGDGTDDTDDPYIGTDGVQPDDILRDGADTFQQKNEDYGSSWTLVGETVALWSQELDIDSIDPSDPREAARMGIYWERLIKLVRAFNLEFSDSTPNNESTRDSHVDETVYAAMAASLSDSKDESDN
jgi:hypothetical protein